MSDPVVPAAPTVSQNLADQAALAGQALQVSQVEVKTIVPDAKNLIVPRAPKNVQSAVSAQTQSALAGAKQKAMDAVRAAQAAAPVVVPPVAVDPPPSDGGVPAEFLAAEPPPVPPAVVEPLPPPEVAKDPKAAHTWAQLRHERAEALKAAQAAADLAAAKTAEATTMATTMAALQKERDEIQAHLEKTNLFESPAFKARYEGKINELRGSLVSTFSQVLDPEQVAPLVDKILTAPPKEFGEILGKVPPWAQQQVIATRAAVQQTAADREKAVTDWRTTKVALQEQEAKDSRIKIVTELEAETAKAVETAVKQNNFMLRKTGDPTWDAKVDQLVSVAKTTLSQPRSRQEIVDLVVEGATALATRTELAKVHQENARLRAELAKVGVRPAAAVRPAGAPPAPVAKPESPVKMRDMVRDVMVNRLGAR